MTPTSEIQGRIRRYLLGQLSDGAREELEQRLLTDEALFDELLIVEDEVIDDYLSGELNAEERADFEKHFFVTRERREKFNFARAFERYLSSQPDDVPIPKIHSPHTPWTWIPSLYSSPIRVAVFAVVVIAIALGVWRIYFRQSEVDKALVALNAAYREQRPLEARISQFDYAPYVVTRGPGSERVNENELLRAELTLLDALNKNPTPDIHHALGKVYLAKKDFDKAIEQFDEAIKGNPKNAQLFADFGAAWLEKGKRDIERGKSDSSNSQAGKGMEELGRGLENLNKALELNPNLPEALFNRALCREQMGMLDQAVDDWRHYISSDPNSRWGDEARRYLETIENQQRKSQRTFDGSLNQFLAAYRAHDENEGWTLIGSAYNSQGNSLADLLLDSCLSNDANNSEAFKALSWLAQLSIEKSGDRFFYDIFRQYALAPVAQRERLTKAREALKQGNTEFREAKFDGAVSYYETARQAFESNGDRPEAELCAYRIGHCHLLQPDVGSARTLFVTLEKVTKARHYEWLRAQTLRSLAHASFDVSRYSEAANFSNDALTSFEKTGDLSSMISVLLQLAGEEEAVNSFEKSLGFVHTSLIVSNKGFRGPKDIWGIYVTAALDFGSLSLHLTAVDYLTEALRIALQLQLSPYLARSYVYLAEALAKLNRFEEAIVYLQKAFDVGKSLGNQSSGAEIMANASLHHGEVSRLAGDHARAILEYDRSIALYEQSGFAYFSYQAHRGKLLSYVATNNDPLTAAEINAILPMFDAYRSKITDESQRIDFFNAEQSVYDIAIDFALSRKRDAERAFEYSEASRARSLRDAIQSSPTVSIKNGEPDLNIKVGIQPRALKEIKDLIPDNVQLVEYAVMDSRVAIWVITRTRFEYQAIEVGAGSLEALVHRYLNSISRPNTTEDSLPDSKLLYSLLIQPIEKSIDRHKTLVIVPDKSLNFLPFAALMNPASSRYLVEDFEVENTPSANLFIDSTEMALRRRDSGTETILSVGNPTFDRQDFPSLANLPNASREAEEVARNYDASTVLTDRSATERAVRHEIGRADVVHLATHFVVDSRSALLSKFVLSKGSGAAAASADNDGVIEAREVYQMKLPRTKLVILSACETAIERQYRGEGAIGIARPFLAKGIPLVVASLWQVDSESTTELMARFHQYRRKKSTSTVKALAMAQRELIGGGDTRYRQPFHWASFVTIGGYADF